MTIQQSFPQINDDNHRIALVAGDQQYSYQQINQQINLMASGLLAKRRDLTEERIAFFLPASVDYVTTMLGIWRAGGIAVPLNVHSTLLELEHYLHCAGVCRLIARAQDHDNLRALCQTLDIELFTPHQVYAAEAKTLPIIPLQRRALMLFTSGTTNKPKGVVTTHHNILAQVSSLLTAWEWQQDDVIPLFLPLHHIHGIINILCCGLWAGATVHLFEKLDLPRICQQVSQQTYSLFMAVPTVYVKLNQYFDTLPDTERQAICHGFGQMRLNVSGSAACPESLFNEWQQRTGQQLLERYGMTEIGMGISNPYRGERRAGSVGQPLPGVEVGLFDEDDERILEPDVAGEIRIKGDNVFLEYWNDPQTTAENFNAGWFCTGDVAKLDNGYYTIMGRASVDIIKSGGYKLSALEIESCLLNHPAIKEVAVIGVEDGLWGEAVQAVLVLKPDQQLSFPELKDWCGSRLSNYKVPKTIIFIDQLPRNAMGKVTKSVLKALQQH